MPPKKPKAPDEVLVIALDISESMRATVHGDGPPNTHLSNALLAINDLLYQKVCFPFFILHLVATNGGETFKFNVHTDNVRQGGSRWPTFIWLCRLVIPFRTYFVVLSCITLHIYYCLRRDQ